MATASAKLTHVNEYMKCKSSFKYFCPNYVEIEVPGGDILLKPYKRQEELIDSLLLNKYLLVLKSRQIGISTIIKAFCVWLAVFHDNCVIGIISKDGKEATDFARDIRGMIEKLPGWMTPSFNKYTEQSFILNNGSKVFAATVNPMAPDKTLRGKAITFLVIDEAAFIKNLDVAWTSLVPALATSQQHARKTGMPYGTIVLSTPNKTVGTGAWFYQRYSQAASKDSSSIFKSFVIHWKQIPELANDPLWYSTQCALFDHDTRKIEQELELKFLPTSGSFFDEKTCTVLQDLPQDPIETFKLFNGELWKYSNPVPGKFYITGVDIASEYGQDNSTIVVIDYETMEQVLDYQGKLPVTDFCKVVDYVSLQYPGTLVVENNSYGNQVVEHLRFGPNSFMLYKEKRGDKLIPGLSTNAKTRPLMIDALYSAVTQFPNIIKSKRLALELIGLISKPNGKVEGDDGCRDDLALALAFIMYVRKYDPPMTLNYNSQSNTDLNDVINFNTGNSHVSRFADDLNDNMNENNAKIMRHIKENMGNDIYVDVFSLFDVK